MYIVCFVFPSFHGKSLFGNVIEQDESKETHMECHCRKAWEQKNKGKGK